MRVCWIHRAHGLGPAEMARVLIVAGDSASVQTLVRVLQASAEHEVRVAASAASEQARASGFERHIVKPISDPAVREVLERWHRPVERSTSGNAPGAMLLRCAPTAGVFMAFGPVIGGWHFEPAAASSGNWMTDHRARIALEESERLQSKQRELLEQTSDRRTPAERIRIWERLHGLTLPRDANHRLIGVIASQTDLARDQVHEEQRRRLACLSRIAAAVPTADSGR